MTETLVGVLDVLLPVMLVLGIAIVVVGISVDDGQNVAGRIMLTTGYVWAITIILLGILLGIIS